MGEAYSANIEIDGIKPKIMLKDFKISEVLEAIKKNGLDHARGTWFNTHIDPTAGCVLAQGAYNLGGAANYDTMENVVAAGATSIEGGGDYNTYTSLQRGIKEEVGEFYLERQLNRFPCKSEKWDPKYDEYDKEILGVNGTGCGTVIIALNDEIQTHDEFGKPIYRLPTYEDVSNMAEEVLAPYLDETITLVVVGYTSNVEQPMPV